LTAQTRSLGIYSLPIYSAELRIEGRYTPTAAVLPPSTEGWMLARSSLEFAPGDLTGLRELRQLVVGSQKVQLKPSAERWELGRVIEGHSYGNRAVLSGELQQSVERLMGEEAIPFVIELEMAGARSLNFIPNAADFSLSMRGDWPHPGFAAGVLPREREVSAQGFSAQWRLLDLSTGIPSVLNSAAQIAGWGAQAVGVSLVEPGGLYQQNERSSKYGVLLLALTIAALFLSEVLLGVRLHPFHYALVGMALAVFYLLLIAVSEHLGFLGAYLLAALAVIGMIGGYLSALLRSWKRGALAALVLGTLYGFLLVLIRAEEMSLLLGALGLAVLLALVMYLTRRLNWDGPITAAEHGQVSA
jgi:inner membrane protein